MNLGSFIYSISRGIMNLGTKLYEVFTKEVSISWLTKLLDFFNIEIGIPESISLSYILISASALIILTLILYNTLKM